MNGMALASSKTTMIADAQHEDRALDHINLIFELLDREEPTPPRWSRRGVGLRLPAALKPLGARFGRGVLHRISTTGMVLSSSIRLREGELLLVKLGRWGTDQFSFPCRVRRVSEADGEFQLALSFSGQPLKVRYPR
jgi:hypothetical protein